MDRSASGGMAPALQSSNHHSTDYLDHEQETTVVQEVKTHEKVNGTAFNKIPARIENPLKCPEEPHLLADACEDSTISKAIVEGSDMIVTEPCILTGLKDSLPVVSLSSVHLGQGDGVLVNSINHNGWGDCKKRAGGILQENNVSCNNHEMGDKTHKTNKTTHDESLVALGDNINNHTSGDESENHPNGKIKTAQMNHNLLLPQNSVLQSKLATIPPLISPVATMVTYSTVAPITNTSSTSSDFYTKYEDSMNTNDTENCTNMPEKLAKNVEADTNILMAEVSKSPTLVSQESNQATTDSMPQLTQELKYTDLLNSDLSKINMSQKLAHTLQELAASLKGTSMQLQADTGVEKMESDITHTVTSNFQEPLHRSVKSLDFSTNETITPNEKAMAAKEQEARIQVKIKTAVENSLNLDKKLHCLKNKIDCLRLQDVTSHIKKDLGNISLHIQTSSRSCDTVSTTGYIHTVLTESTESGLNFWNKLLGKSQSNIETKGTAKLCESVRRISGSSVKKELNTDEQKVVPDICAMDLDPIVQLTRVEQTVSDMNKKIENIKQAKAGSGILRKELKYIRSHVDPDVTDSSSDEDVYEASQYKKTKQESKEGFKQTKKVRKSFCKWVAERAEISRRWTWLQSRISSLEFSIRQQGDLYTQLRDAKGLVQLELPPPPVFNVYSTGIHSGTILGQTPPVNMMNKQRSDDRIMPDFTPPCSVNQLLNNVQQSTRLLDNLSPLSGGSPSPNQTAIKISETDDQKSNVASRYEDFLNSSARTRQLCLTAFKNRKLIKLSPACLVSNKPLKPKTVPNDSSIMCIAGDTSGQRKEDFGSIILKAAQHDHSYHTVISSVKDIPLSISMLAVMKSKRKWCKKSGSYSRSASLRAERKESKKQKKRNKKLKHKSAKKRERSNSMLPPNHLDDSSDVKRRKLSHMSDTSKKRMRGQSFDSDMESPVVIGGFNTHQPSRSSSGAATPTDFGPSHNTYWKKKKSSEQAFDINNIVIPHGLNSARIEKLAYKEIQTPSWKVLEFSPLEQEVGVNLSMNHDEEYEDISHSAFQRRHDNHEIVEKKKYMAYMEWSISRKGRGSRMSNIRGPGEDEPNSPTSAGQDAGPMSFSSEQFSSNVTGSAYLPSPANPLSPSAKPVGVTTRRMSTDHNPSRPSTPLSSTVLTTQGNNDTSLSHSYSSPILSGWQDGFGPRRNSHEHALSVNRTLSEGANSKLLSEGAQAWEKRPFPLIEEDIRMLSDIDFALQKLQSEGWNGDAGHSNVVSCQENDKRQLITRHSSSDKAHQSSTFDHTTLSHEAVRDHNHKSMKRRRTDSRASSLASHDVDDGARHSDASTASASSTARRRKTGHRSRNHTSSQRNENGLRRTAVSSRTLKAKHNYIHTRLSETDDSSSDSDTDSPSSDDTLTSYDDAGHLVDDYADPEWEFNPRQRDRR
ncbi:uncharacterized protein LOC120342971 isoform X1 [Styela clava]